MKSTISGASSSDKQSDVNYRARWDQLLQQVAAGNPGMSAEQQRKKAVALWARQFLGIKEIFDAMPVVFIRGALAIERVVPEAQGLAELLAGRGLQLLDSYGENYPERFDLAGVLALALPKGSEEERRVTVIWVKELAAIGARIPGFAKGYAQFMAENAAPDRLIYKRAVSAMNIGVVP